MILRYVALIALVAVASGCVEERIVHERRPVHHEYVEVVAPQPPPERVIEVEPAPRPGYIWARGYWHWVGAVHAHAGWRIYWSHRCLPDGTGVPDPEHR